MLRSSLIGASVALLCASAAGQGVLQKHPVTAPVRDAGVLNWATGTWDRASGSFANAPTSIAAFNNTCNWSGGAFFGGTYDCWQVYDEGRIPSSNDPTFGGNPNVSDCQVICGFQFSYCTNDPSPFNAQIGFIQGINVSGIGGRCAGVVQGNTPPSNAAKGTFPPANFGDACDIYVDGTGAFPGTPNPPNQACWLVTLDLSTAFPNSGFAGAPFRADGDCVYEGTPTVPDNDFDIFNWTFEQKGNVQANGPAGPFIVGGGTQKGAGSYGTPSGVDPLTGNPCGNGYGSFDNFWINVATGSAANTGSCANTGNPAIGAGSGCYFFGGWPGNPWASWHMVVWASGEDCSSTKCASGGPAPVFYCTGKTSSGGCLAAMGTTNPAAMPVSGASDYSILGTGIQGFKNGIGFFSNSAPAALPFSGGILCMFPPLGRTPIQNSVGTTPATCDGTYSQVINDAGMTNPNLDTGSGTSSWFQWWYRDPMNGAGNLGTALSNAVEVTYQ